MYLISVPQNCKFLTNLCLFTIVSAMPTQWFSVDALPHTHIPIYTLIVFVALKKQFLQILRIYSMLDITVFTVIQDRPVTPLELTFIRRKEEQVFFIICPSKFYHKLCPISNLQPAVKYFGKNRLL